MKQKYDLIIIGGGAGAFAAANRANLAKKKTLVINYSKMLPLGGTCVNVGCVPSKIMLHQGQEFYYPSHSNFRAVSLKGKADFVEALKETREMVKMFQNKNYAKVIKKQKFVDFQEGKASFVDANTVQVGKNKFTSKNILIATGAETFIPPIYGLDTVNYLTNVSVFNLANKPKSIIILGGGPLALEFGQIFHHFGIKVTILQRSDRILSKFDRIIGETLQKHLTEEGITIHTDTKTNKVQKTKSGIKILVEIKGKQTEISAEKILVATGLNPHTKDLNVERAGVKLNKRGFVKVNRYMQTSKPHIYAAGDVTGLMPLETVAAKQGSFAVQNMLGAKKVINYKQIPSAVFTSPEVAVVGMGEEEYMKKFKTCLCSTINLDHIEKAKAIKDTRGVIRMVLNHKDRRILGVHIVAPMAADIITTATYAIKNKMTVDDIRDTVHVFPTLSEMIKKVAQSFDQNLDDMACCVE